MKLLEKILVATSFGKDTDQTIQAAVSVARTIEQYANALYILRGKKTALKKAAWLLLENEKMNGEELKSLMDRPSELMAFHRLLTSNIKKI